MTRQIKQLASYLALAVYLLVLSWLLLSIAGQQALLRTSLAYTAATGQMPQATPLFTLARQLLPVINLLVPVLTIILFIITFRQPKRLWPISAVVLLLFIGLNLFSGRHLLPNLFIWPLPTALAGQYVEAAAADDIDTVAGLTDGSEACRAGVDRIFTDHRASLEQAAGDDAPAIQAVTVESVMTMYENPLPADSYLPPPIPTQQATIRATLTNERTVWLTLKMRYGAVWGGRYLCPSPER